MNLAQINQLVRRGETDTLEFKAKANHPEKIIKEIVAFANTKGGRLLIGVNDNAKITGLTTAEEELFTLENAIARYCFPKINYQHEIIPVTAKKSIIIYTIFESKLKPHYTLLDQPKNRRKGYIRVADRSVQASKEMKEILRRERKQAAVRFTYGEKEKVLMKYLEQHDFITLRTFATLAGIRPYLASRTLITLVLAKVLQIIPREGEDWYRFNGLSV
jgi:predicted HTH transcriptional regulator